MKGFLKVMFYAFLTPIFIMLLPIGIMLLPIYLVFLPFKKKKKYSDKVNDDILDELDDSLLVDCLTKEERDAYYRGEKTIYELYDISQKRKTSI